jgi:D-alanyl-lipoteichoic acid acyltransferase DltB (MBOAT superfamily)
MLFNSFPFIFGFFPVTIAVYFALGNKSRLVSGLWLAAASLFFYGWWNVNFVGLLLASIIFNYCTGYLVSEESRRIGPSYRLVLLTFGVAGDLLLLAYFKYAGFFAGIVFGLFGSIPNLGDIILPLGISFFTFTQIAFLVDAYRGRAKEFNVIHYLLFVTYFPHLIAGPILHHSQIMPQFAERRTYRVDWTNISAGFTIFVIGLVKKVLVADSFAAIATPVFSAAQQGVEPGLFAAWAGALAYTLQLYFDFSGYSDMAIGLSLCFNVKLPLNFNSPYKSVNIIEFWRRWHMTLSAFLREYLYIPLGGNRKGKTRRYANLFVTMLLGGLWHGAGWTFVVWGALHGIYLMMNHGYQSLCARVGWQVGQFGMAGAHAARMMTFLSVVIAWVFFRSDSFATASTMLHGMVGSFGLSNPAAGIFAFKDRTTMGLLIVAGLAAVWLLPNTQEFMRSIHPAYENVAKPKDWTAQFNWRPDRWWTWCSVGILFALCTLLMSPTHVSEFLYYQF